MHYESIDFLDPFVIFLVIMSVLTFSLTLYLIVGIVQWLLDTITNKERPPSGRLSNTYNPMSEEGDLNEMYNPFSAQRQKYRSKDKKKFGVAMDSDLKKR